MKRTDLCTDKAKLIALANVMKDLESYMPDLIENLSGVFKVKADFNYKDYLKKDVDVSK